ncbi:Ger(x)C family spore germination protein [Rossellomorea sp. SC111]|uniref:Ger(x)C family spore germination protein n=1 Tax=Rossellomorea sp. SC111 TaxID=2968985 RepID=UPI00215B301B|nr:Ger(x)C family spore germination protein [Rossellomorea sp. SC111]MCR8848039.1 Ger(x)C family spore germination protein [Rossellomorea sp. SC111]
MNKRSLYLFLLFPVFLTGCIEQKVVDEIGIIHNVGFDYEDGGLLETAVLPEYTDTDRTNLISAEEHSPIQLKSSLSKASQYDIQYGQIRVLVLGKELSEKGITEIIESICKEPSLGNVRIATANERAADILKATVSLRPLYLMELVDNGVLREGVPDTSLHTLLDQFYGQGLDVYIPNLKVDSSGILKIDGLSIFKGDKLKLAISNQEMYLFKLMNEKNKKGTYEFTLEKEGKEQIIGIESLYGKHDIVLKRKNEGVVATINLKLDLELNGLPTWMDIKKGEDREYLKNYIERTYSKEIHELLTKFQTNQVDPLGLGIIFRAGEKGWSEHDFYQNVYPDMKFKVNTDVIIRQSGAGKS